MPQIDGEPSRARLERGPVSSDILLVGGDGDPQILRLWRAAAERGLRVRPLLTGISGTPALTWDIQSDELRTEAGPIDAACAFVREDVFTRRPPGDPEQTIGAHTWWLSVSGWLLGRTDIRLVNREQMRRAPTNKPRAMRRAAKHGLHVPRTLVTNDIREVNTLVRQGDWIHKPVAGGDHCRPLEGYDTAVRTLDYPFMVQERLVPPELRIYRIGERFLAFDVASDALDYRTSSATTLKAVRPPEALCRPLAALADELGLEFAAADFKSCPHTGQLLFLEINSNPMFVAFDIVAEGRLVAALLDLMVGAGAVGSVPESAQSVDR